jgi:pyridoxamine 5'-phosphate oxidase
MPDTPMPATTSLVAWAEPFDRFSAWLAEAVAGEPNDPTAMTLATCTADGRPSARMVLLKGHDARGFVFYTNVGSRKGGELAANAQAALLFHWKSLRRQVRIEGRIEPVTAEEADAYYASRPRQSRIGAWASDQSRPLAERAELERRLAEAEARFPGDAVPRPPHWSGFRVVPHRFEFWRDMPYRLHDRLIFARDGEGEPWATSRLFP